MEQFRIGFIAHGPATANSLKPIIDKLESNPNIDINLYSFHTYVSELWSAQKIDFRGYPISLRDMDLLIYGTGSGHAVEQYVAGFGKKHNIKTMSILDLYWATDSNIIERFPIWPDYLIVPNAKALKQINKLKPTSTEALELGNPHFDRLHSIPVKEVEVSKEITIGFFSQCSTTGDYSDTKPRCKEMLNLLSIAIRNPNYNIKEVLIAPHPREDQTWLRSKLRENIRLNPYSDSTQLLIECDIVVGVTCTLQYEAAMIDKPVIFFNNKEDFRSRLLNRDLSNSSSHKTVKDSTNKIVTYILDSVI